MIIAALGLFTVVTWPGVPLAIAIMNAETIPAPVTSADYDKPSPGFGARFAPGTQERALLEWLRANQFEVGRGRASRDIQGPPCLDHIDVEWAIDKGGRLTSATATLIQEACL